MRIFDFKYTFIGKTMVYVFNHKIKLNKFQIITIFFCFERYDPLLNWNDKAKSGAQYQSISMLIKCPKLKYWSLKFIF